jgi:nucleotide-binding universal stress UspA family protein
VIPVVGFDGSASALRALDAAARMVRDRVGSLEVVYVAHVPVTANLSAQAAGEMENGFEDATGQLGNEVRDRMAGSEQRWHFQRRDGAVAGELLEVAGDLRRRNGPDASVVIVIGRSAHRYHHVVGSVSHSLERQNRFPILIIP